MHQSRTVCLRQLRLFENLTPIVNKLLQYSAFGSQKPHRCFPFARPRQVWTYSSIILPQSVSFRCGIRAPPGSLRPRVHIPKRFLDRFIRFGTAHARNHKQTDKPRYVCNNRPHLMLCIAMRFILQPPSNAFGQNTSNLINQITL